MKLGCIVAFLVGFLILLQRITTKKDKRYENVP